MFIYLLLLNKPLPHLKQQSFICSGICNMSRTQQGQLIYIFHEVSIGTDRSQARGSISKIAHLYSLQIGAASQLVAQQGYLVSLYLGFFSGLLGLPSNMVARF